MVKVKDGIKELHPRDPDAKYIGPEPMFDPNVVSTQWDLSKAFSWYNHFYDNKDAKEFIAQYLDVAGKQQVAKTIRRVNDRHVVPTYGWLARCIVRGSVVENDTLAKLQTEIDRLVALVQPEVYVEHTLGNVSNRPNVQEIMRERTLQVGGELEGQWDDYLKNGAGKEGIKAIDLLSQRNILPQHVHMLVSAWQSKLDEYNEVAAGKCEQLNEAYERFGKIQLRNIVNAIETVISDLNAYIGMKKAGKKPRAKKAVPVEKIVRKLKYLKTFKLEKLELESISPTKLHNCSEAWVYDTKKRKLHHYIADEYTKSLSVKGNTVIGFCTKESQIKTLRKPEEQIKVIMGSKPAARKFFDNIKAVGAKPNGRFNANMIILRAF
jgi:hypothetical protein